VFALRDDVMARFTTSIADKFQFISIETNQKGIYEIAHVDIDPSNNVRHQTVLTQKRVRGQLQHVYFSHGIEQLLFRAVRLLMVQMEFRLSVPDRYRYSSFAVQLLPVMMDDMESASQALAIGGVEAAIKLI